MKIPNYLLRDRIELKEYLGTTGRGESYSQARKSRVKIEENYRIKKTDKGQERAKQLTIYSNNIIPPKSIILSLNGESVTLEVKECMPVSGLSRTKHYKVVV